MTDHIETLTSLNISGLSGEMIIPGDKSVSHRPLILGGMATGQTKVTGLLMGADVLSTLNAVRSLGVTITRDANDIVTIYGVKSFSGSLEEQAAQAFSCKKKAEALKKELENMIRFVHGPTGLKEYKDILRDMRKQKEKTDFRKAKMKQAIIEWTLGIIIFSISIVAVGFIFWFIGKNQGRW